MKALEYYSNSEINELIYKTYKTNIRRNILHDRLIENYTYEELIDKYYPHAVGRKDRTNALAKIKCLLSRLALEMGKRENDTKLKEIQRCAVGIAK